MRGRGIFLPLLLFPVLWVDDAQGRGSPNTWIEATETAPSCTLDVVLVTFKDTSASGNPDLDYHRHDLPYGTNEGQSAGDRYKLADFERLFNGGYDDNEDTEQGACGPNAKRTRGVRPGRAALSRRSGHGIPGFTSFVPPRDPLPWPAHYPQFTSGSSG